jgi:hypothetical protein
VSVATWLVSSTMLDKSGPFEEGLDTEIVVGLRVPTLDLGESGELLLPK